MPGSLLPFLGLVLLVACDAGPPRGAETTPAEDSLAAIEAERRESAAYIAEVEAADSAAHANVPEQERYGGTIVVGFPTVLIGGQPAARVGDMHACPMVTPGVPPVPHVGGPITGPGSPTVLIGGMPAARMGNMCTCTGPPDSIVKGLPTVIIA